MEFYSADIEMLMSGWNTLYVFKLILLILFEYLEELSGKFDPRPLLIDFQ
jgi:hypothetical protein